MTLWYDGNVSYKFKVSDILVNVGEKESDLVPSTKKRYMDSAFSEMKFSKDASLAEITR